MTCFWIFSIFLLICYCQLIVSKVGDLNHGKTVVCYMESWSSYRNPGKFTPHDIDPSLCTHIVYVYVSLKNDTYDALVSYTPHTDLRENYGLGYYSEITDLKKSNPHLKVLLCLGGWVEGSIKYSELAKSSDKRKTFASNAAAFLRDHNFDGLDIFWQYPGQRGGSKDDKNNYPILLKEIKDEFKKHGYILTVFLSVERVHIDQSYNIPSIAQSVDWINLYTFAYNTPWGKIFGINSPLDSNGGGNVKKSVMYYLEQGVPSNKLVIILPTTGYGYKNTDQPGQVEDLPGLYPDDKGYHAFHEVCKYITDDKSGWTETWDNLSSTPIAINGKSKISYENQISIKMKVRFANEKKLRGVGVWTINNDDFKGDCKLISQIKQENENKYPILKAINEELNGLPTKTSNHISVSIAIHPY